MRDARRSGISSKRERETNRTKLSGYFSNTRGTFRKIWVFGPKEKGKMLKTICCAYWRQCRKRGAARIEEVMQAVNEIVKLFLKEYGLFKFVVVYYPLKFDGPQANAYE